jgi:hypothetical protein
MIKCSEQVGKSVAFIRKSFARLAKSKKKIKNLT